MNDTPNPIYESQSERRPLLERYVATGLPIALFLVVLAYMGTALDPFTPVKEFIIRTYAFGGILIWFYDGLSRGYIRLPRSKTLAPLLLLLAWNAASFIYAPNKWMVYSRWLDIFCCSCLFMMVLATIRSADSAKKLLSRSMIPVLFLVPLAFCDLFHVSFFPWDSLVSNRFFSLYALTGFRIFPPGDWTSYFDGRVSASFGNPVYLAGFLILMIPPAWVLYTESSKRLERVFHLVVLVSLEFLLVATFTRSAWAFAVATVPILWGLTALSGVRGRTSWSGIAAMAVVFCLLVAWFRIPGGIYMGKLSGASFNPSMYTVGERLKSIADTRDSSGRERLLIWKTSLEMIKANPLKGVGLDNYIVFHPKYQVKFFSQKEWKKHTSYPDRVHNEYLDIFAETGLVGLVLFLWLAGSVLTEGLKAVRSRAGGARISAGLLAGLSGIMLYSTVQFPLHVESVMTYVFFIAAILCFSALPSDRPYYEFRIYKCRSKREKLILAITLTALFMLIAQAQTRPLVGHVVFSQAERMEQKNNRDIILTLMDTGSSLNPGNIEMRLRATIILVKLASIEKNERIRKQLYEAIRDESLRGISTAPMESRFYSSLGNAYIRLGQYREAAESLQAAIFFAPDDALSFYNSGIAYYMSGNYNLSAKYYGKADALNPGLPGVKLSLGLACIAANDFSCAAKALENETKRTPSFKALHGLAIAYTRLGRQSEAISSFRQAIAIAPKSTAARIRLATLLSESNDTTGAAAELKTILRYEPGCSAARRLLSSLKPTAAPH